MSYPLMQQSRSIPLRSRASFTSPTDARLTRPTHQFITLRCSQLERQNSTGHRSSDAMRQSDDPDRLEADTVTPTIVRRMRIWSVVLMTMDVDEIRSKCSSVRLTARTTSDHTRHAERLKAVLRLTMDWVLRADGRSWRRDTRKCDRLVRTGSALSGMPNTVHEAYGTQSSSAAEPWRRLGTNRTSAIDLVSSYVPICALLQLDAVQPMSRRRMPWICREPIVARLDDAHIDRRVMRSGRTQPCPVCGLCHVCWVYVFISSS